MAKLTVLSFGGGQDSTAILHKFIYDKDFRDEYAPEDLLVVMAETGNEHSETYDHVMQMEVLAYANKIRFEFLDYRYTPKSWKGGLVKFYEDGNRVGSKAFPKTCTDNLKIKPIYNFLEQHIHETYRTEKFGRKRAIKEFAKKYGKIDMLIGIAKGEEVRASTNEESPSVWMREAINKVYPLLDLQMDRQACQDYILSVGQEVPIPSACIICPFMNDIELLYLKRFQPYWLEKWIELEVNKIKANQHVGDKNLGVWGNKLLPEKVAEVELKYGHMTDEEVREYRMSHGHCVKSKY